MACETTRQIWQQADDALAQSVQAREAATAEYDAAKTKTEASRQQLADDEAAEQAAQEAVTAANDQVNEDAQRAGNAYQNHMDCLTGTGRIDATGRR